MFSNLDTVASLISEMAEEEVLPRFRNLTEEDVSYKKGGETVTVADTKAEKHLSRLLKDKFPGCSVLGEELYASTPSILDNLVDDELTWVIDPIDGTNNFARGDETFRIMLALLYKGETVAGWIYNPVGRELLEARKGAGAYLAEVSLKVPNGDEVELSSIVGTLHGSKGNEPELVSAIEKNRSKLNVVKTLRCAGADYERLATARTNFALFTRLMPWDHLPGVLIFQEAGGYAACLNGQPYLYGSYRESGLLMAPNQAVWAEIDRTLFR